MIICPVCRRMWGLGPAVYITQTEPACTDSVGTGNIYVSLVEKCLVWADLLLTNEQICL